MWLPNVTLHVANTVLKVVWLRDRHHSLQSLSSCSSALVAGSGDNWPSPIHLETVRKIFVWTQICQIERNIESWILLQWCFNNPFLCIYLSKNWNLNVVSVLSFAIHVSAYQSTCLLSHGSGIRRNVNKLGGDNISHSGLIKAKTTSSLFSETILNTNILMVPQPYAPVYIYMTRVGSFGWCRHVGIL